MIPSVAVQGEATPREAQLVAGPGFVWECTQRVGGVCWVPTSVCKPSGM